ncbi:MAG: hypothetical protein ACRED3_18460, partial [Bradyrhizobium sp.]
MKWIHQRGVVPFSLRRVQIAQLHRDRCIGNFRSRYPVIGYHLSYAGPAIAGTVPPSGEIDAQN